MSKLSIIDQEFGDVSLDLFAFSPLKPRDSKTSATPAIAFALRIKNLANNPTQVSFLLNLPMGIQPDTGRLGKPYLTFVHVDDTARCSSLCDVDERCMLWQMDAARQTCQLFDEVPLHIWHPGSTSGQKSTWIAHDSMLTLNRPGNFPQSGNTTILTDKGASVTFMVSNSFADIWKRFDQQGYLVSSCKSFGNGFYGAASVNITVESGMEQTLTMVLGWFYPNRDFTGMLFV